MKTSKIMKVAAIASLVFASSAFADTTASKDNDILVRAGWMQGAVARGASSANALKDPFAGLTMLDDNGFYIGGAFDFNVNNDLFGLYKNTSFQIELGAEYGQFGKAQSPVVGLVTGAGATATNEVTVNQLRVSVAPKIKFMHDSKLRPWIIPVGMDINIVSPPSIGVSYLNPGLQSGAGLEYNLLAGIKVGADVRYHYSWNGNLDGVNTDGVSAGGYVGFNF